MVFDTEFARPAEVDAQAATAVIAAMSSTERGRSFGRLTDAAAFMAACQGKVPAEPLRQPRVVIFYGHDNEEAAAANDIAAGSAPVATLARTHGAGVRVEEIPAGDSALQFGSAIADSEIDAGADLLIPGELGEGFSTEAAALFGALTKTEPVALASLDTSLTTQQWQRDVTAIRDHMFRCRTTHAAPLELLTESGTPAAQALVGFILQATARRTPVLIDGCLASVCGLLAEKIAPGTRAWLYSSQISPEPAHIQAVQKLELTPMLAFDLNTGQGTGGVLALSALNAAIELVSDEVYAITEAINAQNDGNATRGTAPRPRSTGTSTNKPSTAVADDA